VDYQETRFPKIGETYKFKSWARTQKTAIRFVADFEATLEPIEDITTGKTRKLNQHHQSGYSWMAINWANKIVASHTYNVSQNDKFAPAEQMIQDMLDCCDEWYGKLQKMQVQAKKNMIVNPITLEKAKQEGICCLCKLNLDSEINGKEQKIVMHHSHLPPTGKIFLFLFPRPNLLSYIFTFLILLASFPFLSFHGIMPQFLQRPSQNVSKQVHLFRP
jgi:hypothetical protein